MSNSTPFYLGGTHSTNPYGADLDEVSIWSSDLSSEEVFSLYESQKQTLTELSESWTPKWNNIVGYWKMDGNWQDSSRNGNNGSANGNIGFVFDSKVGNQAGTLDGVGDSFRVDNYSSFGPGLSDFSLSFWLSLIHI